MKQIGFVIIVIFLLILCSVCNNKAAYPPLTLNDYYPSTPRSMTYECKEKGVNNVTMRQTAVHKPRILDGVNVIPSVVTGTDVKLPATRFYEYTTEAVYLVASQAGDNMLLRYESKVPMLKMPIKTGTFFDSNIKATSNTGNIMTLHYTCSIDSTNAVVRAPYGEFTNCIILKIRVVVGDTTNESVSWIAPKIGLVKSIERTIKVAGATEKEISLKSIDFSGPVETAQIPAAHEKKEGSSLGWLTDNAVANMKGVEFLRFYIATMAAALIFGWWFIRKGDSTREEAALPLPANPDPYELAYLRGGVQEVIRLAVFKLVQVRSLAAAAKNRRIGRVEGSSEPQSMSDMERVVYRELSVPQKMASVCKRLSTEFKELCYPLETRLNGERLLVVDSFISRARLTKTALLLFIVLLSGYKLVVALSRGRTNVMFLVFSAFIGVILTVKIFAAPRLSARGRDYLKRFQKELKDQKNAVVPDTDIENPALTLLVALSGFAVLHGTPYALRKNNSSKLTKAGMGLSPETR
ncbi:membrane hypothetical protein [Syntrophobacter sp. SbD2]|nr:membrane hypothetical protein [Syntrophobacter sp. SbD2]